MDYSPPGPSVYRILQKRIQEWVAMSSSSESSQPRDQTHISYVIDDALHLHHQKKKNFHSIFFSFFNSCILYFFGHVCLGIKNRVTKSLCFTNSGKNFNSSPS